MRLAPLMKIQDRVAPPDVERPQAEKDGEPAQDPGRDVSGP